MKLLAVLLTGVSALQPLDRRATLQGFAGVATTSLIPMPTATAAAAVATPKNRELVDHRWFDSDFPSQINFIGCEKAYRAIGMTRALKIARPYERASWNSRTVVLIWAQGPSAF